MPIPPIQLSQIMIEHSEVESFFDFLKVLASRAKTGEAALLELNLKPEYPDTPRDWEMQIEAAFSYGHRYASKE